MRIIALLVILAVLLAVPATAVIVRSLDNARTWGVTTPSTPAPIVVRNETAPCARQGEIPALVPCCRGLIVMNGRCGSLSRNLRPTPVRESCAKEGTPPQRPLKPCCEGLVVNRVGLCATPPPVNAPRCSSEGPNIYGPCCPGLINFNGICIPCKRAGETPLFGGFGCCAGFIVRDNRCQRETDCAEFGQRAADHGNNCCPNLRLSSDGTCRRQSGGCASQDQDPRDYNDRCCDGFVLRGGVCKKMGCAQVGENSRNYANGCCRGLVTKSSIFCEENCGANGERPIDGRCCTGLIVENGVCTPAFRGVNPARMVPRVRPPSLNWSALITANAVYEIPVHKTLVAQCYNGARVCDGNTLLMCKDHEWKVAERCDENQVCASPRGCVTPATELRKTTREPVTPLDDCPRWKPYASLPKGCVQDLSNQVRWSR